MKKQGLWSRIKMILRMASRFADQHTSSLEAMEATYIRRLFDEKKPEQGHYITLKISPYGSIYKVTQVVCLRNTLQEEHCWLATYGWHSNGHLIEIGGYRYCIFDPLQKTLYLEDYNHADIKTLETYTQI
ncbi:hypothetical protein [Pedobacter nutrimenti]|uniref:hypothetical protein n=1 Tax=Pedobacter nutrimenti TaxID=1241337 RepID=UPI00292DF98A|nr:hypothetical protein [Pedobacter nutrimenti]